MIKELSMSVAASPAARAPRPEIRAQRPMTAKPVILKEYYAGGQRMYRSIDGRRYIADAFDRTFIPQVKMAVIPRNFKSVRSDGTKLFMR